MRSTNLVTLASRTLQRMPFVGIERVIVRHLRSMCLDIAGCCQYLSLTGGQARRGGAGTGAYIISHTA